MNLSEGVDKIKSTFLALKITFLILVQNLKKLINCENELTNWSLSIQNENYDL